MILPRSLYYSRDFPFGSQFPETNPADIKISHITGFTAALPTAPDNPGGKFGLFKAS
jgi:hypothetical protein